MEIEDIKKYQLDGYFTLNEDGEEPEDFAKIKLIEFCAQDIQTIIRYGIPELLARIKKEDDELLMAKYSEKYHITPEDFLVRFEFENNKENGFDYDDIYSWSYSVNIKGVTSPNLDDKSLEDYKDVTDYLFENDDHLLKHCIRIIRIMNSDKPQKEWEELNSFLKDIIKQNKLPRNQRTYKDSTLSHILYEMSAASSFNIKTNDEFNSFYHTNVERLAKQGNYTCMRLLGYNYYEGDGGFPLDPKQSLYWLEKAYQISQDPDLARTIGYIYYYGRTTDGVPQGDKAFQYFAIGHFAGGYYEATYKLADCYLKGYGTPVNEQAAFNLVSSIFKATQDNYLSGEDSKFADVALRIGSYFKDGVYVDKDLIIAQGCLLQARDAIKTRLENMEYVGDRSVALSISKALNEVEKELDIKDRTIVDNGYELFDLNNAFKDYEIRLKKLADNSIEITIKSKKEDTKYIMPIWENLSYTERAQSIKIVLKNHYVNDEQFKEFYDKKWQAIDFYGNEIYLSRSKDDFVMLRADHIIYVPQKIKKLGKDYKMVSVEFYPGSKQYDYYCEFDTKVGDIVKVYSNGEKKEVRIVSIKNVYEDQLPLPLQKLSKVYR